MLTSEVTSKGQVTKKIRPFDKEWHDALSATLSEWDSQEDEEEFRGVTNATSSSSRSPFPTRPNLDAGPR